MIGRRTETRKWEQSSSRMLNQGLKGEKGNLFINAAWSPKAQQRGVSYMQDNRLGGNRGGKESDGEMRSVSNQSGVE